MIDPGLPARYGSFQTTSGAWFSVFEPRVCDVRVYDIARSLSNLTRFGGHLDSFYSVAQHSVIVSRMVSPAAAKAALFHDATEAYLLDLPRPAKHHPEFRFYREIESRVELVVAEALGFPLPLDPEIKAADNLALALEVSRLRAWVIGTSEWEPWLSTSLDNHPELRTMPFHPMVPDEAFRLFVARCDELGVAMDVPVR